MLRLWLLRSRLLRIPLILRLLLRRHRLVLLLLIVDRANFHRLHAGRPRPGVLWTAHARRL